MSYGHLKVITGPMYASKTTELLKAVLWARNGQERDVLVVKPAFDNRYSEKRIVTHDGLSTNCHSISSWSQVSKKAEFADMVFFDEVQFFEAPNFEGDIVDIIRDLLKDGKSVVVNGLDLDVAGKPFAITATMLALADDVVKLRASCAICGRTATKTSKVHGDSNKVELGSTGMYEPRCNEHWTPAVKDER